MKRNVLHIDTHFEFEAGGSLDSMDLVYHTSPREYTEGETVVWICHALTGSSDPEDWWNTMVGKGLTFDPDKVFVVCVSMLCSPYGMCGPATINPATGKPYLLDFPKATVRDVVNANILVRKALGINKIDILMGPSIGGFQTLEWLVMEPDTIRKAVILATSDRATPYLTAYNESQRMAILADPTFLAAESVKGGQEGLKCARSIALISYRTREGYNASQQETDEDTLFASRAASYQRYQGQKLINRDFDAYSYWYLTLQLDSHNLGRGRGGVEKALSGIKAECTVIDVTSDQLFPADRLREISGLIPGAAYHEIDSIFGHDGFFIESGQLAEILKPLINNA